MTDSKDIPVGFAIELAMHPEILNNFSDLPRQEQDRIIDDSRHISSRDEIRKYVETMVFR